MRIRESFANLQERLVMKTLLSLTLLFCWATAFVACQHDTPPPAPNNQPQPNHALFHVLSPLDSSTYHQGDTVPVSADIFGEQLLHGYMIYIHRTADTNALFRADVHIHNDTLLVRDQWIDTLSPSQETDIDIIAYLDHDGDTALRRIRIHCQ